jgi:hypothetical protein
MAGFLMGKGGRRGVFLHFTECHKSRRSGSLCDASKWGHYAQKCITHPLNHFLNPATKSLSDFSWLNITGRKGLALAKLQALERPVAKAGGMVKLRLEAWRHGW